MAMEHSAKRLAENIFTAYSSRDKTLLTIGSIIAFALFATVARVCSIPQLPGYEATLFSPPSPLLALLVTAITLIAATLLCSLIAGVIHFEGGLFCAAVGMAALSTRGGPMRYVLMYAPDASVYGRLAFETALLFGCVAGGWYVLLVLRDNNLLRGEPLRDDDPDALPMQGAMALVAQVVGMMFLIVLLAQTDQKAQVIWSVAIASLLASLAAHSLFPARPSPWFWSAPFIVAIIGYLCAWSGPWPIVGGQVGGPLPALARPLPLDYASVGTAGSLLGYWTSRRWQHEREAEPHTTGEVEEALETPPPNG
jgi:hypothetical protein